MEVRIELARLAYAELILRCTNEPPEIVEDLLSLDGELEKARRWFAFAEAKRRFDPNVVRGLLVYLFSHYASSEFDSRKRDQLVREINEGRVRMRDLTIERLAGTRLSWEHIFRLVGHQFNPTREKEKVKELYVQLYSDNGAFTEVSYGR
jgi:hypothetical protein